MDGTHRTDHKISRPQTAFFRPGGRPASFLERCDEWAVLSLSGSAGMD